MKTAQILLFAAILAGTASLASAGQSPQFANQPPKATTHQGKAVTSAHPASICGGCKTTQLRDPRQVGAPKGGIVVGAVIGAKHTCTHCGGS